MSSRAAPTTLFVVKQDDFFHMNAPREIRRNKFRASFPHKQEYIQHLRVFKPIRKTVGSSPYIFFPFKIGGKTSVLRDDDKRDMLDPMIARRLSEFADQSQWVIPREVPLQVKYYVSDATIQEVLKLIDQVTTQLSNEVWYIPYVQVLLLAIGIAVFGFGYANFMAQRPFIVRPGWQPSMVLMLCVLFTMILAVIALPLKSCFVTPREVHHFKNLNEKLYLMSSKFVHEVKISVHFDQMERFVSRNCFLSRYVYQVSGIVLFTLPKTFGVPPATAAAVAAPASSNNLGAAAATPPSSAAPASGSFDAPKAAVHNKFAVSRDFEIDMDFLVNEIGDLDKSEAGHGRTMDNSQSSLKQSKRPQKSLLGYRDSANSALSENLLESKQ
eukprot:TRINITY_DN5921_c0_g1_i1.p1 TRINITY_DN5921_c0_g1~~TRINITY_DN5921_c0_g1_i1.p1  ORF type:complete len:384 (+),score=109.97 TRINITY_DN5921_c0_g1_i1:17-1168(+)